MGLQIKLDGALPDSVSVTVMTADGDTTVTHGGGGWFWVPTAPDEVTVQVEWEGGTVTETFTPVYENVEINGPGCGSCRNGEVVVTLPTAAPRSRSPT